MARIKMHIPKAKLPFYPPCEVKCRLQNGVSTATRIGAPLSVIRMDLVPIADKGLSFLFLILAYISLLNFVVISARREHLSTIVQVNTKRKKATLTNLKLTFFSLNVDESQHVRRRVWAQAIKCKSPRIHQVVLTFYRLGVLYRLFNTTLVLALRLRSSLDCTRKRGRLQTTN